VGGGHGSRTESWGLSHAPMGAVKKLQTA
jgi:hypothetical protein